MNDSANSNGSGQSARERLDELAASAGDDGIAQIAATLTNGLADVEKMFDKHAGRLDAAADKFGVVVGRLQELDAAARQRVPKARHAPRDRRSPN